MIIGIAVAAVAGFVFGIVSHIGDPIVHVEVINGTDKAIGTVTVWHEHGTAVARDIGPGTRKRLQFFAPGETSFRTTVEFVGGQHLEEREQYAEAGYRITATVTENGVNQDVSLY